MLLLRLDTVLETLAGCSSHVYSTLPTNSTLLLLLLMQFLHCYRDRRNHILRCLIAQNDFDPALYSICSSFYCNTLSDHWNLHDVKLSSIDIRPNKDTECAPQFYAFFPIVRANFIDITNPMWNSAVPIFLNELCTMHLINAFYFTFMHLLPTSGNFFLCFAVITLCK